MPLPKQVKPTLPLVPKKTLYARREQLLEFINKDGTYLPKSVLHADLDRGMLDFVKEDLKVVTAGKIIPMVDIIITTQNWSQYVETALFTNLDFNPEPPFITVVRQPEVKFGTNPSLKYNIPNRKQFYYASVPTWNGNEQGMDIYTIPQPIPQMDARKYFIQTYDFTMLGYLIDEEEFEVKPAIARVAQIMELDTTVLKRRRPKFPENPDEFLSNFLYIVGNDTLSEIIDFRANMSLIGSTNIDSFDVYINGDYFGTDVSEIQITTNDILRIDVVKTDNTLESNIEFEAQLV